MTDMLVKLYALPALAPALEKPATHGVVVRRVIAPEKHLVLGWVRQHFSDYWVSECDVAFGRQPSSCFIAVERDQMLGFACYDSTARGFFGPTGVNEAARGKGIGAALLLAALHDMAAVGYGYAIIGGVGPADFYEKVAGATLIPDSTPGVYRSMLGLPATE
ncbi:MAG: GNAT family N-acetyltransferase [Phototrophicaceae bacterium]|jgi:GNAT superfamily N-acetyltransferase